MVWKTTMGSSSHMKRRHLLGLAGTTIAGAAGCLSPTLPLPPPDEPESIGLGSEGQWQVRGACEPGATVLVKNNATGTIVGVEDRTRNGRYFVEVEGDPCDRAEVWQLVDGESSTATGFLLEERVNGLPVDGSCLPA